MKQDRESSTETAAARPLGLREGAGTGSVGRPTIFIVLGILNLAVAALCEFFWSWYEVAHPLLIDVPMGGPYYLHNAVRIPVEIWPSWVRGAVLLAGGVGLLRMRRWGRGLTLAWAAATVGISFVGFAEFQLQLVDQFYYAFPDLSRVFRALAETWAKPWMMATVYGTLVLALLLPLRRARVLEGRAVQRVNDTHFEDAGESAAPDGSGVSVASQPTPVRWMSRLGRANILLGVALCIPATWTIIEYGPRDLTDALRSGLWAILLAISGIGIWRGARWGRGLALAWAACALYWALCFVGKHVYFVTLLGSPPYVGPIELAGDVGIGPAYAVILIGVLTPWHRTRQFRRGTDRRGLKGP